MRVWSPNLWTARESQPFALFCLSAVSVNMRTFDLFIVISCMYFPSHNGTFAGHLFFLDSRLAVPLIHSSFCRRVAMQLWDPCLVQDPPCHWMGTWELVILYTRKPFYFLSVNKVFYFVLLLLLCLCPLLLIFSCEQFPMWLY